MLFFNVPEEAPLYYFEQISLIPRESGNEKEISDYILSFAKGLGLEAYQSPCNNLIIKKPASTGYEDVAPVILQAHMDMVCEKHSNSKHDFTKDPILLKQEGQWITSETGTTLGADNGIGVAYCMALLADDTIPHPPVEVILTVSEESDFSGAENVDWDKLDGRRLINLDHSNENEILVSSCGGTGVTIRSKLQREYVREACEIFEISVSGLKGGHSGEDIHRGHGSANALLIRILRRLKESAPISLMSIDGGTSRLAISREASAKLVLRYYDVTKYNDIKAAFESALEKAKAQIFEEYEVAAPDMHINLRKVKPEIVTSVMTEDSFYRILNVFTLLPDGIQTMSGAFPGTVNSSINLGIIHADTEEFAITAEIRGGNVGAIEEICAKVSVASNMCGCSSEFFTSYMPWAYQKDSALRKLIMETYEDISGAPMKAIAVHAGIECGCFLDVVSNLDAVSIGPDCRYFHSPEEKMDISSALRVWEVLKKVLAEMK